MSNCSHGQGYVGDLVVRTDNTTVSYMRAAPEWLIDEYEEMIEFVASVPPILTLWENHAYCRRTSTKRLEASMRGATRVAPSRTLAGRSSEILEFER